MASGAAAIDSQTAKMNKHSGRRCHDGGKNTTDRKGNLAVDTLGLRLAVMLTLASINDAQAAGRDHGAAGPMQAIATR